MTWFNLEPAPEEHVRIIKEEHEEFQKALGTLTLAWADLEKVIRATLRHYSGVSRPVAQALFSGVRARVALSMIEAVAHNTEMEVARLEDLKELFPRIKAINTMRDLITHNVDGSMIESDDSDPRRRKLSNNHSTAREGKGQTYWVSSEMLHDMCHDTITCCWRLQAHWEPSNNPFRPDGGPAGELAPWRYKAPQPVTQDRAGRGQTPE